MTDAERALGGVAPEESARTAWDLLHPGCPPGRALLHDPEGNSSIVRLLDFAEGTPPIMAKLCDRGQLSQARLIFEDVLYESPLPMLGYYGAQPLRGSEDGGWLFVEEAQGEPWKHRNPEHRRLASAWLGRLHAEASQVPAVLELVDVGPRWYESRGVRALEKLIQVHSNPALDEDAREQLDRLAATLERTLASWNRIAAAAWALPLTLVHGDFSQKNVRIRLEGQRGAVSVFDWEHAGVGPPSADLEKVDVATYWSVVERSWGVDLGDVEGSARAGRLFRAVAASEWAIGHLKYSWLERPLRHLALYEARIVEVLNQMGLP